VVWLDGTTPKSPAPSAPDHNNTTENGFPGRKTHILVVEDNLTNQQVALGILNNLGLSSAVVD
jgi:hypothetical protein